MGCIEFGGGRVEVDEAVLGGAKEDVHGPQTVLEAMIAVATDCGFGVCTMEKGARNA
jgi:hypothetical protein